MRSSAYKAELSGLLNDTVHPVEGLVELPLLLTQISVHTHKHLLTPIHASFAGGIWLVVLTLDKCVEWVDNFA
jgi:hypothetical protein